MACQAGAVLSVAAGGGHGGGWAPQIPESESACGEYSTPPPAAQGLSWQWREEAEKRLPAWQLVNELSENHL